MLAQDEIFQCAMQLMPARQSFQMNYPGRCWRTFHPLKSLLIFAVLPLDSILLNTAVDNDVFGEVVRGSLRP